MTDNITPAAEPDITPEVTPVTTKSKGNKGMVFAVIALLVSLIVGGAAFFYSYTTSSQLSENIDEVRSDLDNINVALTEISESLDDVPEDLDNETPIRKEGDSYSYTHEIPFGSVDIALQDFSIDVLEGWEAATSAGIDFLTITSGSSVISFHNAEAMASGCPDVDSEETVVFDLGNTQWAWGLDPEADIVRYRLCVDSIHSSWTQATSLGYVTLEIGEEDDSETVIEEAKQMILSVTILERDLTPTFNIFEFDVESLLALESKYKSYTMKYPNDWEFVGSEENDEYSFTKGNSRLMIAFPLEGRECNYGGTDPDTEREIHFLADYKGYFFDGIEQKFAVRNFITNPDGLFEYNLCEGRTFGSGDDAYTTYTDTTSIGTFSLLYDPADTYDIINDVQSMIFTIEKK